MDSINKKIWLNLKGQIQFIMTRELLIKKTMDSLTRLPDQKLREVSDFAEFLITKIEDRLITEGIQKLTSESKSFKFLEAEEDIYSNADLKELYK